MRSRVTGPVAISLVLLALLVAAAGFVPSLPALQPSPPAEGTPTATAYLRRPLNDKIGLHTRLTDEPDQEKIRREFSMLREMGGTWATEFFPWAYIQNTDRERYDWEHADLVVDAAEASEINLIARLDGVPGWARPADKTWRYLAPERYEDFGNFVRAFVSRYRGRVRHYVIWNEPNLGAEWGQRPPDPRGYVDLLKVAYARAKEADPEAIVMMAGLAPTLEREGSAVAMDDLVYLRRAYEAGAKSYFDALAVHSYGLRSPADEPPEPGKVNFRRVEEIRRVMVEHGDSAKDVYMTEGGWNDSARWSYGVRPSQRVRYTVDAYKLAQEWPWLRAMCLWASRYPRPAYTYFDSYTFLAPDFTPKAVYLEVREYARFRPLQLHPRPPQPEER
jgi:polysaccharide biosynthesis protein PslG